MILNICILLKCLRLLLDSINHFLYNLDLRIRDHNVAKMPSFPVFDFEGKIRILKYLSKNK